MSAGALDSPPQNGAVVTLLAVCGSTHSQTYFDIAMTVGPTITFMVVIALGSGLARLGSKLAKGELDHSHFTGGGRMRIEKWTVAAAMAALLPCVDAGAATEANFALGSTGDLVALCSAAPDNGIGTAALNFCEGYLQGAVTVEMLNMPASAGPKLFCLPNPPPARSEAIGEFVSWAQAGPGRMTQSPTDGVFGFLRDRYPCPAQR